MYIVNSTYSPPFFMPSQASISGGLSSFKKFSPLTRNVKPPMTVLSASLVYYQNKITHGALSHFFLNKMSKDLEIWP